MPLKKKREKRAVHSDARKKYLLTGEWNPPDANEDEQWDVFAFSGDGAAIRAAWEDLREELLADWIREHPGTRPWGWWKHDAPRAKAPEIPAYHLSEMVEPRQRIGGAGAPTWEKYPAILPYFTRAIPDSWEGIDKADPPQFESEASYLRRHNLFLRGEKKRVPADAYQPEVVTGE